MCGRKSKTPCQFCCGGALIASMTRYIEQLEALKNEQRQRIEALQKERDELHRHLHGDRRCS